MKLNCNSLAAKVKSNILAIPGLGKAATAVWELLHSKTSFKNSRNYWEQRYTRGGNSGSGSYNRLAEFKADTLNEFVKKNQINDVIEFGCGDGNQLRLANYSRYIGFDISDQALNMCRKKFKTDPSKTFKLFDHYNNDTADLALSLDVIYHLVEDNIFDDYMHRLFSSARRFIVIYSSNDAGPDKIGFLPHVKHRNFTTWVRKNAPEWTLCHVIKNRYPYSSSDPDQTSLADFYFYQPTAQFDKEPEQASDATQFHDTRF